MRSRAALVALMFVAALRAAHADPADDAYREGRKLYDLQEWDQAIEKFKLAYKLRPEPASLFNIAQAYRLKGDCAQASRSYKTYKRNYPDAKNIAKVDRWIAQLESCATSNRPSDKPADAPKGADDQAMTSTATPGKDAEPTQTSPAPTNPVQTQSTETKPVEPPPPAPAETKPAEPTPVATTPTVAPTSREITVARPRLFTWITFGVAGAAAGTGAFFGYRARNQFQEYQKTTDQTRYHELHDDVQSNQHIANVSFIAAGGLVVAGAVLFFVEGGRTRTVQVAIDPSSHGISAWGHF